MADVRSLLRQQRAARRIEHPHAAYSDAGKLLCTLCHEAIKSESLWDGHIRGSGHTTKLKAAQQASVDTNGSAAADGAPSNKRKHDSDEDMEDEDAAEAMRKKRSKTNMSTPARLSLGESDRDFKEVTLTPPSLNRRTSTTPVQGVEIQIPSRPHTPAYKDGTSSNSTPIVQPVGPSPLIPQEAASANVTPAARENGTAMKAASGGGQVDEDEWAAFEADIAAATAPYAEDAVIAAPAMTAEETAAAAKTEEEEQEKRRLAAEKDLLDEKEEATRALETEFEDMEELEARVRRLKEKREALRRQSDAGTAAPAAKSLGKPAEATGKENVEGISEEEEDEDEDEDEDDFMGFRYRS
ncbi:zinc finger protein 830-like protein [Colletotrichum tofieldiae]|uniref:Zinc finger protein 830-like protein n=1 Tax=Colletotrichum tofieldiae TaxID=708197 RepID=A0A166UR10_9PEZI|nr:zinc finger protein 830-like protein [Colletotrichum tofieldiae]GKT59871.1 zinc finger protein 830-like protein [Colletotrichum tofieldiae]GKT67591.1 zinc finger protein 830-like protein [Colletotrichum tofieldiae]GKT91465.1 zinc finger protein 830-like protein [Colletotrichum tofieldiae]